MEWDRLLTSARYGKPDENVDEGVRHPFHKDFDRLVFSSAFRRLGRKAQVHPLADNDHIHTRLTHSMEVSCVGRSLGMLVGSLIADKIPLTPAELGVIVQAACLAHDIGNPPFGHAGEFSINDWFKDNPYFLETLTENERRDLSVFDGNAQGFRIVTCIEVHQFDGGLRLTYPTLGTMIKYPWCSISPLAAQGKFSSFLCEMDAMKEVMFRLGVPELESGRWARHPLSYLLEAADDICYAIMDLEDAVELDILSLPVLIKVFGPVIADRMEQCTGFHALPVKRSLSLIRGWVMEAGVQHVAKCFMHYYSEIMHGSMLHGLLEVGGDRVAEVFQNAKQLARDEIFPTKRKLELEIGAYNALSTLLYAFCDATHQMYVKKCPLSFRARRVLSLMGDNAPCADGSLYQAYRRILDYIGGMTDRYAIYLAEKIGAFSH